MPVPNQKLFYPCVCFATPLSRTQTFRDQAVGISITVKRYDLGTRLPHEPKCSKLNSTNLGKDCRCMPGFLNLSHSISYRHILALECHNVACYTVFQLHKFLSMRPSFPNWTILHELKMQNDYVIWLLMIISQIFGRFLYEK